ncbi:sulfotransferase [Lutimaribacter sp. EGI FJ00015]|uniref:Sulfotransferase n=1 Tax=Lutimaribacter degradans TaxID=2945989 RepID=A0ACC5ZZ22_9RHOB|nr:sulfotransferase [Lutimaribacter sp. EGI FJ00013]MCM2563599.1 sulfotransferase [Lutimaribacter sp. EGI FJ00013]MCO0614737.1 sulfotransferase [Lutimaribacter sp. EGI FJ00015]MCO0637407.1 sulfotransferase [Lutimaribacter sp. EGI FJ00014]
MANQPHRFDARFPNLKGSIFIVTYGRSGSTLLQTVLQSIPDAHICGENDNLIMPIWQANRKAHGAKRAWGKKSGDKKERPWYGTNNFRPRRFANRMIDTFVDDILRPPSTASWIGFKEIRYSQYGDDLPLVLDFMAQSFKNPYFIFNTRKPESVAQSGWWRNHDPEKVMQMVRRQDERFAQYSKARPDNTFIASYEELTADFKCLEPMFEMLGEEFDASKIKGVLNVRLKH